MPAPDLQLEPQSGLGHFAESFAQAEDDALRFEIAPARSVVNLRGAPADQSLVTDTQRMLGIELPLAPNRWHGSDHRAALWLGPDEWLLVAGADEAGEIEQAMREARPTDPWLSVVDVSHSYTRISLSGPGGRELLAKGCSLDLNPDVFPSGGCAQTHLAGSRVLLRALDDNSFEIWVRNSFARYMAAWLLDALGAGIK